MTNKFTIKRRSIGNVCRKWKIREFSIFGSVLRKDFRPNSDIDVLVSFDPDSHLSLMEIAEIRNELIKIFGREVDIVEKEAIRNPFRKHEILSTRKVIYG